MGTYEDLAKMMRGKPLSASETDQIGIMTGSNSLKLGDMVLTSEDLMFADHLVHPSATMVSGSVNDSHVFTDKSSYLPALKAGDEVLVRRMSDTLYIVKERLVRA